MLSKSNTINYLEVPDPYPLWTKCDAGFNYESNSRKRIFKIVLVVIFVIVVLLLLAIPYLRWLTKLEPDRYDFVSDLQCHEPLEAEFLVSRPNETSLFHHRNNIRYGASLIGWAAHHDWIQVAVDTEREDPRPPACFHPDSSFDIEYLRKSGCIIYKTKAKTLQDFMKQQVRNSSILREEEVFALQARVVAHVALKTHSGEEFRLQLIEESEMHLEKKALGTIPLLRKTSLLDNGDTDWDRLWKAARCTMPMYSELGVQGDFIEDHLRNNRRLLFSLPPEKIITTPIPGVSSACGRLAVEKLIPMSLVPYDKNLYDGTKSFIRALVHRNDWDSLGCSSTTGTKNCQSFPRCWLLAIKKVQQEHAECRTLPAD